MESFSDTQPTGHVSQESSVSSKRTQDDENYKERKLQKTYQKHRELLSILPKRRGWEVHDLFCYNGFWFEHFILKGVLLIQQHFKPRPTDILLTSCPKTGTTWLKALVFAITNRANSDFSSHPLLSKNPHDLIPFLETSICQTDGSINPELEALPSPRLLQTHVPYSLLPHSMTNSGCKFVYVCRDPKDVVVSTWYFFSKFRTKEMAPFPIEEAFDMFCEGFSAFGPYWNHVLEYWKASLEAPEKALFLKYEDLKKDPMGITKRLAEFLGQPFSAEEESEGMVEEIIKLCSFQNLISLGVNRDGVKKFHDEFTVNNRDLFRKGSVGDWKNHFTEAMAKRLDNIIERKLSGTGFAFGTLNSVDY